MSPSPLAPTRRTVVRGLIGSTSFWLAAGHLPWREALAQTEAQPYAPQFFSSSEWAIVSAAAERIFPEDEAGPGAAHLGIPEFIDRQMDTPYGHGELWYMSGPFASGPANLGYQLPLSPRDLYRQGLARLEDALHASHGKGFAALSEDDQIATLHALEHDKLMLGDIPGSVFFAQLRTNTMEGAFSDPLHGGNRGLAGWTMLGFPGARADFMDWVDQYGPAYPLGSVSISGQTA